MLGGLTKGALGRWDRLDPGQAWSGYWAHYDRWPTVEIEAHFDNTWACHKEWLTFEDPGRYANSFFMLPMGKAPAPHVLADGGHLTVWVDTAEGWLWAALPKEPEKWLPGQMPDWLMATESPHYYSVRDDVVIHDPALVRRRITEGEATSLLDFIMPSPSLYKGLPSQWAQVLRMGGWLPHDLTVRHACGLPLGEPRLWWQIEDLADAQALARKLPARWRHEGWPLNRKPHHTDGPPARYLGTLVDEGIRPQVVAAHRLHGRSLDIAELRRSMEPVIPDDATRVRLTRTGRPYYALTAASARAQLAKQNRYVPTSLVHEVQVDTTPGLVPLHVDPGHHYVVWSDGAVDHPAEVFQPEEGHVGGTWDPDRQRLLATRDLLMSCIKASNWRDLKAERVWEAWLDAISMTSSLFEKHSTQAHGATRTLALTQHIITLADATEVELWEVAEELTAPGFGDPTRQHSFHTSEEEARDAMAAEDALPPVMTIKELAPVLGTTPAALRKALHRERQKRYDPISIGSTDITTARAEPGWVGQVGSYTDAETASNPRAAHLYDPRVVSTWWEGRPGHGPGRGHKK